MKNQKHAYAISSDRVVFSSIWRLLIKTNGIKSLRKKFVHFPRARHVGGGEGAHAVRAAGWPTSGCLATSDEHKHGLNEKHGHTGPGIPLTESKLWEHTAPTGGCITSTQHPRHGSARLASHLTSDVKRRTPQQQLLTFFSLFNVTYKTENPPLTFHIQAILFPLQTMVDRLFLSAPTRRAPRPFPNACTHVCIAGGHADAVRLNAGTDSINSGVNRYSSPLSGNFFFSHGAAATGTDPALLLAGRDAEARPPLCHVRAVSSFSL